MNDNRAKGKTSPPGDTPFFDAFTMPLFGELERPKSQPLKSSNSPVYDTPLMRRSSESVRPPSQQQQQKQQQRRDQSFPTTFSSTKFQVKKNWVEITGMEAKKNINEKITKEPATLITKTSNTRKVGRVSSIDSQKSIYKLSRKSLFIYRSMSTATIQRRMGLGTSAVSISTPPEILEKNYIFEREVACGGFSILYQASYLHDRTICLACKHIRLNDLPLNSPLHMFAKEEAEIMSMTNHTNIIELVDVLTVGRDYYIFMKYAVNGNLFDYLYNTVKGPLWEDSAKEWLGLLFNALTYLHRGRIVHRDLKLDNFFLDANNNILLGDFGFAVRTNQPHSGRLLAIHCGTTEYMAPEVNMAAKYSNAYYDPYPADVYSMGVCMFEMLNHAKPFKMNTYGTGYDSLVTMQNNKDYQWRTDRYFTDECKDLLNQLLEPRSGTRPTSEQVLAHIWFRVRLR